jgi:hypothetical protein
MTSSVRRGRWWYVVSVVLLTATTLTAAEGRKRQAAKSNPSDARTVEMFAAIEKGEITVKLFPKNTMESRVVIENKTDKPLTVKLPSAFAGVPMLAQIAGGGAAPGGGRAGGRSSRGGSGGGNQTMGGGMGGGGGGGGLMGGGQFNVAPEQVGRFKVPTVCLEHGKSAPHSGVPYAVKPIDSFTTKPGVRELCEMLGKGEVDQRAAQAAAWHLNNDMSWEQLASKQLRHLGGTSESYFSPKEIQAGMQVASAAVRTAKEREKSSPTTTSSGASPSRGD